MISSRRTLLLETSSSFCASLIDPPPPKTLLSKYFSSHPRITEHGPSWAQSRLPFLGKTFSGLEECMQYFELLSQTLSMDLPSDAFPTVSQGGFVVDVDAKVQGDQGKGVITVVGKGSFKSLRTGKGWSESFIYRLSGFDDEGRIGHWEIWADPLSAWVAVGGEKVDEK
jgi:hypothetical protein